MTKLLFKLQKTLWPIWCPIVQFHSLVVQKHDPRSKVNLLYQLHSVWQFWIFAVCYVISTILTIMSYHNGLLHGLVITVCWLVLHIMVFFNADMYATEKRRQVTRLMIEQELSELTIRFNNSQTTDERLHIRDLILQSKILLCDPMTNPSEFLKFSQWIWLVAGLMFLANGLVS